jgi:hypothetical protein
LDFTGIDKGLRNIKENFSELCFFSIADYNIFEVFDFGKYAIRSKCASFCPS